MKNEFSISNLVKLTPASLDRLSAKLQRQADALEPDDSKRKLFDYYQHGITIAKFRQQTFASYLAQRT